MDIRLRYVGPETLRRARTPHRWKGVLVLACVGTILDRVLTALVFFGLFFFVFGFGQVEKKSKPSSPEVGARGSPRNGSTTQKAQVSGDSAAGGLTANDDHGGSPHASRQPSLRQQEKAPEGRPPHAHNDVEFTAADVGAAHEQSSEIAHDEDWDEDDARDVAAASESRFTEGL